MKKLKCVNADRLPGNDYAPKLIVGNEYELLSSTFCPKCGQEHYDVGLRSALSYVSCYTCKDAFKRHTIIENSAEGGIHWCYPSRFVTI